MYSNNFYVVWAGAKPGIYASWAECQAQTHGYPGAKFKKYAGREEAEKAYRTGPGDYYKRGIADNIDFDGVAGLNALIYSVIAPDPCPIDTAMCVHVTVDRKTGDIAYDYGWHMPYGNKYLYPFNLKCPASGVSQNIAEFDALVTGLIMLKNNKSPYRIYTQSDAALRYLELGCIDDMELAMLKKHTEFATIIEGKFEWLSLTRNHNRVGKWNLRDWGHNPAAPNSNPF